MPDTGTVVAAGADVWSTAANVATVVGVLVALAATIVTLIMTLRSERLTRAGQVLERQQAEATAARSEAAAALTEEYTRRVVLALETVAAKDLGPAGLAAESAGRSVVWSLTHHSGDTYLLKNEGTAPAQNVSVNSDDTLHLIELPNTPTALAAGEALTFMAAPSMGTRDRTITIHWQDERGDIGTWRYPLPPRPPR